jgi:hypothetical protein
MAASNPSLRAADSARSTRTAISTAMITSTCCVGPARRLDGRIRKVRDVVAELPELEPHLVAGNVLHADAYVRWMETGEGEDPCPVFSE